MLICARSMHLRSFRPAGKTERPHTGARIIESNTLCNLGFLNYPEGRLEYADEHLATGLIVAREIGNVMAEAIILCNLGVVKDALAEFDEAASRYDAALAIARESSLPRLEGHVLGCVGVPCARRGKFDEARSSLDAGEALLRKVSDGSERRRLAVQSVRSRAAGLDSAATAAFEAAETIAAGVSAGSTPSWASHRGGFGA